jgi:protein-disulfide isomerase-like protein with CxxC motif
MVVVTATITVNHMSDPGCPWAWSASPAHAVLQWRYGDQLDWKLIMIGLAEDTKRYDAMGYGPARGAIGYIGFKKYGMPFDFTPRSRNSATGVACRAVVATRLHAPGRDIEAFRALQLSRFTTTDLFDEEAAIRVALSRVDGLDVDTIVGAIGSEEVEAAYQEDRAYVRTAEGGPTHFQGKSANSDGAERFTAPSIRFEHTDGGALEAGGFQSLDAYDVCIANLDQTLERRKPTEDVVEILEAFPFALSTHEVAAIMSPHLTDADETSAEVALIEAAAAGSIRREPAGHKALWHIAR